MSRPIRLRDLVRRADGGGVACTTRAYREVVRPDGRLFKVVLLDPNTVDDEGRYHYAIGYSDRSGRLYHLRMAPIFVQRLLHTYKSYLLLSHALISMDVVPSIHVIGDCMSVVHTDPDPGNRAARNLERRVRSWVGAARLDEILALRPQDLPPPLLRLGRRLYTG